MYITEILIVMVGILYIILIVNCRKQEKDYQKYVDSIRIGDTFGHNSHKFSNIDNPFSENYGTQGFDPDHYVTILDIKKNNKGETWVKYCFTRNLNDPNDRWLSEWTKEINDFLKYRTRISKRVDNINTNE